MRLILPVFSFFLSLTLGAFSIASLWGCYSSSCDLSIYLFLSAYLVYSLASIVVLAAAFKKTDLFKRLKTLALLLAFSLPLVTLLGSLDGASLEGFEGPAVFVAVFASLLFWRAIQLLNREIPELHRQ